jgi:hypothetical protein
MKYFIRTYTTDKDEVSYTEKEVDSLKKAQTDVKVSEKIHICLHDEGLPCLLIDKK